MKDAFEKLFRAVHQFKKLNVSDLIPGLSSSEFSADDRSRVFYVFHVPGQHAAADVLVRTACAVHSGG